MKKIIVLLLVMIFAGSGCVEQTQDSELAAGFQTPPDSAKPWTYWWWLDSNVSKVGITADLEAMKEQGIAGAMVFDAGIGGPLAPDGPAFMSPKWREHLKFALQEADRLGMQISLNLCSGWNAGGPWVKPQNAAKEFVWSETIIQGGKKLEQQLDAAKGNKNYYRDTTVVAFKQNGQKAIVQTADLTSGNIVDLTSNMDTSGKLLWDAPEGTWNILRMGYTLVDRGVVHCTSPSGGGLEIDPLSRKAMDMHFDATVGACIDDMGEFMGKTLKYTHIDSWELGVPKWTDDFQSEFKHRRGYDPLPYLPALAGKIVDSKEVSDRFLHDCRRTVADCTAENYYGRLSELSRKHGMGIHPESGGPFFTHWIDALQCMGKSDIPMGEYWARRTEPSGPCSYRDKFNLCDTVRQAASAAHIYGKKCVQAEAYTTMGPNWEKDPYMLKDIGDLAFCAGLTRNMLCFYVHQPYLDIKPGNQWEAAGTHFDRNITWFPQSHAWLKYLSRCQFMLGQGMFVADVCYYYGESVPGFVPGRYHMNPALSGGYDCDTINTEVLLTRVSAKNGRIVLPDGMNYRMLVLPNTDAMSLPVLKKVSELTKAGVTVVGSQPTRTPGLRNYPASDEEVKKLASKLKLVSSNNLHDTLSGLGIGPDFQSLDASLHYIHRRSDDADIYFVSNQENKPVKAQCGFRVTSKQPEIWDAVTGEIRNATAFEIADGRTVLPLELPARGSLFVVFRKPIKSTKGTSTANFTKQTQVGELTGPWTVKFDTKWGGPKSVVFEKLVDWTERAEPGIKFYSGKATYHKTFDLPKMAQRTKKLLYLDLKRIRNVAHVRLNGKDLGVVWTAPWRVDISQAVKPTGNKLEIDVVNLWPNRLIGDAALPPEKRLTKTNVTQFEKDSPLLPSGLLGPVQLITSDKN